MDNYTIGRRKFLGRTAAVGLGVLAHPSFNGRVFGANDRIVMGIIGAGGRGRGMMNSFAERGVDWAGVCDVYQVNLDLGLEAAAPGAKGALDHRRLLERSDIDAVLISSPEHWHHEHLAAQCSGKVYKLFPSETPDTFCAVLEYPMFTCTWTLTYTSSYEDGWGLIFQGQKGTLEISEGGYRVYKEPWGANRWKRPEPVIEKLPGGLTQTDPHIENFLECVRTRKQPNATIELGFEAVRSLHLANLAYHKQTRAALAEDGVTVKT